MVKLCQIVAVEKGAKSKYHGFLTNLDRESKSPGLFNGMTRSYGPLKDEGERLPDESTRVQRVVNDSLAELHQELVEVLDLEATKDFGNTVASADIKVGDTIIAKDVPPTFLLALEKRLVDIRTCIERLPILDEAEDWSKDGESGLFKSQEIETQRTRKEPVAVVKYEATKEHPAQTELFTKDVIIGYWRARKTSGAIPQTERKALAAKAIKLLHAVKQAREEANSTEIERQEIGEGIASYLFG